MRRTYFYASVLLGIFLTLPLTAGAAAEGTPMEVVKDQVTVCILDSGCNLSGVQGKNYLDSTQDLTDQEGHGTFVYEILKETAPDADIYMLKCFDSSMALTQNTQEAGGEHSNATDIGSAIIQAIYDAVDVYDADIINMSWTLNQDNEELHEAMAYAARRNVLLVAAAGNLSLSTPLGSEVYPAVWKEVIGVSGADLNEQGEPVSSLWYLQSDAVFVSADGNYQGEKGSSYAAPRISGILANHLFEVPNENHTKGKAEEYLKEIATDAGDPGYDTTFGLGYVETSWIRGQNLQKTPLYLHTAQKMPEYSGIFDVDRSCQHSYCCRIKTVDFYMDVLYDDSCETGGR